VAASEKVYYPALTGFRALAAYLVFFHHANPFSKEGWQFFLYSFTNEFHVGVSLFFVLSGFLIYSRYAEEIVTTSNWFKGYIQNRLARIYPLYFILTTVVFVVLVATKKQEDVGLSYFLNITLLKGFFDDFKFSGIAQGWSLTVEECFYLLAPLIFLWAKKFKLFHLGIIFLAIGFVLVFIFRNVNAHGFFGDFHFMLVYTFFGRSFEFLIGIWVAKNLEIIKKIKIINFTYGGLIFLVITVVVLSQLTVGQKSEMNILAGVVINNFILPIAVGMIIAGLILENTRLQKLLTSPLMTLLGKSSYAFYLVHAGIFFAFLYRYVSENIFVLFVLLNVLAIGLYYFIEKPLNERWKVKRALNG
jgi:peptidoglycan/LPS O-acetylase OafA/YrhL